MRGAASTRIAQFLAATRGRKVDCLAKITYHLQSGWFEDTPLKGGTEEGCPLKGVHEGTFLIEARHPTWNDS